MNRLIVCFVLGLVVGAALRHRLTDNALRQRYNAVKTAEAGGNIDLGISFEEL